MFSEKVLYAFLLTLAAGLSTGIGSVIALFSKKTNAKFLSVSLGFSAGVMIYVSMTEIFFKAKISLSECFGDKWGLLTTVAAFFCGIAAIALIDKLIPLKGDTKDITNISAANLKNDEPRIKRSLKRALRGGDSYEINGIASPNLLRSGLFTALALGIHNFPEGLATFMSALRDLQIAVPIVAAIAIHNIPEGIAVSVPVYYATGNKKKAFGYSFLSGITEPLGAAIGYFILLPFLNDAVMGIVFAAVAGIMVFISIDELLPSAREYGEHRLSVYGLFGGMAIMATSLVLFA
ncbi:MAG: zinc transporter ZupT [Clostridiales bacterium]|jgi:ZIP family zinc transporter|nr:zinc transporter ZupT [Clostridiales bacterium]